MPSRRRLLAGLGATAAVLSSALVAPVHAVAIVSPFEHRRGAGRFETPIDR